MTPKSTGQAVLSPALILGFGLRPLPQPLLQVPATLAMLAMRRRHGAVFDRLAGLANPRFLIDPVDVPVSFLLSVKLPRPELTVLRADEVPAEEPAAAIRGPISALIDLLEGRVDGDALFFSRTLNVEGDMAAVVALRNAVDGEEISLRDDLLDAAGPLQVPVRHALKTAGALYNRAERDLETLRAAFLGPLSRRCDAQDSRLRELDESIAEMKSRKQGRRG